jgi:molybdate transport system regulatory protein
MKALSVRFRVDLSDACAIGPGKVALLEAIATSGSLSQAARDLHMSYRRAWLLLTGLNASFRDPVVTLTKGGRGGGGAIVTAFGETLIAAYRGFEADVQKQAKTAFATLSRSARADAKTASSVMRRPLTRREISSTRGNS